jgi:uncharacterized membrane-anchored protein
MMRRTVLVCLAFVVLAGVHIGIPVSMLAERAAVLTHGAEVKLALTTQDPRSLFRGDYSNLVYAIGNLRDLPAPAAERERCAGAAAPPGASDCMLANGREVFVRLEAGEGGVFRAVELAMAPPPAGDLFIRGKVRYGSYQNRVDAKCPTGRCFSGQVTYGIETWFGPQGVPAQVDRAARSDVVAVVRIDIAGTAVLDHLLVAGEAVGGR